MGERGVGRRETQQQYVFPILNKMFERCLAAVYCSEVRKIWVHYIFKVLN